MGAGKSMNLSRGDTVAAPGEVTMIWHPKKHQLVQFHYRKSLRKIMPWHGERGTVYAVGNGKGPKNVLVGRGIIRQPRFIVVPRGNLIAVR